MKGVHIQRELTIGRVDMDPLNCPRSLDKNGPHSLILPVPQYLATSPEGSFSEGKKGMPLYIYVHSVVHNTHFEIIAGRLSETMSESLADRSARLSVLGFIQSTLTPILLSNFSRRLMPPSISSRFRPRYLMVSATDSCPRNLEITSSFTPAEYNLRPNVFLKS